MTDLENEALRAHRSGQPWAEFWRSVAPRVQEAVGHDPERVEAVRATLMHLLTTGERSGMVPPGVELEPIDDQDKPPDIGTRANILNSGLPWVSAGFSGATVNRG